MAPATTTMAMDLRHIGRMSHGLTNSTRTAAPRAHEQNHDLPPSIAWIPDMIAAPFFAPCATHATGAKGEMLTLFSLRDRCSLCPVCAVERKVEHTVQVRMGD